MDWIARAIIAMVLIAPNLATAAETILLLEVYINQYATKKVGKFSLRDGVLMAQRDELSSLGFKIPAAQSATADGWIALPALDGFEWRLDQASQTLFVATSAEHLLATQLQIQKTAPDTRIVESSTGATLNYDVIATALEGQYSASGLFDLRIFSPQGVFSTEGFTDLGKRFQSLGKRSMTRLDTTYTLANPATLRTYRAGDFITGGLSWSRPIRLAGMQIISDYSTRPDMITYPLPTMSGSAAVPSTVDVLVNNTRMFSHSVEPGPFQIQQLPVVTGAGTIAMTLTNMLGQQVVTTVPFLASATLLAPGLQTFSMQAGAVRHNWSLLSNDYRSFAASASWRRGLSANTTVEATAEATSGTYMLGSGLAMNVGNFAVLNLASALSTRGGHTGTLLVAGFQHQGVVVSLGASISLASRNFSDIAAATTYNAAPRRQINANIGLSLGRFGSTGAAYTEIKRDIALPAFRTLNAQDSLLPNTGENVARYFQLPQHTQLLSVGYSLPLYHSSFYLSGFHDFANEKSSGIVLGLTIPFGTRNAASLSASKQPGGSTQQAQIAAAPAAVGDWGYQLYNTRGDSGHQFAQLQYKAGPALLTAGVDHLGQQTSMQLESQGALTVINGAIFASNTIEDSFAVVDTNGLSNIGVLQENRKVGDTNSAGLLLVPELRSFDINHLAIESANIPADTTVTTLTREVRPPNRAGIVVKFPLRKSQSALLQLVDEKGTPVPLGSTAKLRATSSIVPVGYDGNAYLEGLDTHNEIEVERPNGQRCRVSFDYHAVPGDIPKIGPLLCQELQR